MNEFNYREKKLESIKCNICEGVDFKIIEKKSVNNLDVQTVMCKNCSLIFINPRMSSKDYDEYYMRFYRKDRAEIKQKTIDQNNLERNFENARKFGKGIISYMGEFVKDGLTIDVGSSTGGILYGMREMRPNLKLLGIEPSLDESNYANEKGVETVRGLFEDVKLDLKEKAMNVLCVQSLNHLLDPKSFLTWAHSILDSDGHVFLAVKNWRHQVRRAGKLSLGIQIDHVYMFTPETLKLLCEVSGFKVVYMDVDEGKNMEDIKIQKQHGLNTHHIRIVAKRLETPVKSDFKKTLYLKTRMELFKPFVKFMYILKYSNKLAFLRKILHI